MCLGAAGEIFALCKKVALADLHVEHFSDAHVKMRQNYHLESAFILPLPCQAVACILIEHFSVHFFFSENKQCSSTCWFYNAEYEWNYANEQKDTRRKKKRWKKHGHEIIYTVTHFVNICQPWDKHSAQYRQAKKRNVVNQHLNENLHWRRQRDRCKTVSVNFTIVKSCVDWDEALLLTNLIPVWCCRVKLNEL